jgi:hypothetical protein
VIDFTNISASCALVISGMPAVVSHRYVDDQVEAVGGYVVEQRGLSSLMNLVEADVGNPMILEEA